MEKELAKGASRCKECNSFTTRLSRTLTSINEFDTSIVSDYNNLSKDDKSKFYADNHQLLGKDLAIAVCETVAYTKALTQSKKVIDRSLYKDEIDLTKKYKEKPEM